MVLSNGKYISAKMILNPFPIRNDGLLDITWVADPETKGFEMVKVMTNSAKGGVQTSDNTQVYMRGKKIKITFIGKNGDPLGTEYDPQSIVVDGENLVLSKFIVYECLPGNINFCMLPKRYFDSQNATQEPIKYKNSFEIATQTNFSSQSVSTQTETQTSEA